MYSKLVSWLPELRIVEIVRSVVAIEMEFVIDALPVELIGMTSAMMCKFIKFYADQLLITLGYHVITKSGICLNGWKQ
jgi:ribonucleotide reductase beta subunit family protein with ferritin-like domain